MKRRPKNWQDELWSAIKILLVLSIVGAIATILGFFALLAALVQATR